MKKTLIFLALITGLFFVQCRPAQAQEPQPAAVEQADTLTQDPEAVASVPDSLCVVVKNERICLPTDDAEQAAAIIAEFAEENKGRWPKSLMGWVTLLVTFAFSIKGTQFLTSLKGVYNFLRVFLRKTLHIVAFIAAVFSTGITFLVGKGSFDFQVFLTLWGITAFIAVYIYETWIKKPEPVAAKQAPTINNA